MEHQLVVFELAKEHCGVDLAAEEGIIKLQPITVVPHTPAFAAHHSHRSVQGAVDRGAGRPARHA